MSEVSVRATVAERAARAGGEVARRAYRGELSVSTKGERTDLVTEADVNAQRQVVATIAEEFPDDAILGEEEGQVPAGMEDDPPEFVDEVPESGPCWVIDPIDGTTNFVRGVQPWATAVSAVVDGEPVAAANYLPVADEMYATRGDGAARDGDPIAVSDRTDPGVFVTTPLGKLEDIDHETYGVINSASAEVFGDLRRFGSMQAVLSYVATGGLDAAYVPVRPPVWDAMGGVHLIREAGGTVTDADGDRWTPESDSLVASNGEAHDVVCEVTGAGE
jgi:myo-inositol-1(or 4)-monophosphatase